MPMTRTARFGAHLNYTELMPAFPDRVDSIVIGLHSRASSGDDLIPMGNRAKLENAVWVFPHGTKRVGVGAWGQGSAWYDLDDEGDRQGFSESRDALLAFIPEIVRAYNVPLSRSVLYGFSQGAVMALDVGLRIRQLAGLVAMSGYLANALDPSFLGPVLMQHGADDPVVDLSRAWKTRETLESSGVRVDLRRYPMGHEVSGASMEDFRQFLLDILSSGLPAYDA